MHVKLFRNSFQTSSLVFFENIRVVNLIGVSESYVQTTISHRVKHFQIRRPIKNVIANTRGKVCAIYWYCWHSISQLSHTNGLLYIYYWKRDMKQKSEVNMEVYLVDLSNFELLWLGLFKAIRGIGIIYVQFCQQAFKTNTSLLSKHLNIWDIIKQQSMSELKPKCTLMLQYSRTREKLFMFSLQLVIGNDSDGCVIQNDSCCLHFPSLQEKQHTY